MTDEDQMRIWRIQAEGMRAMSEKELTARDLRIAPLLRNAGMTAKHGAAQNMMNGFCRNMLENVIAERKPLTRWARFVRWIKNRC